MPIQPGAIVGHGEAAEPGSPLPNASWSVDVNSISNEVGHWPGQAIGIIDSEASRAGELFDLTEIVFGPGEEVLIATFGINVNTAVDVAADAFSLLGYHTTGDEADPRDDEATPATLFTRLGSGNVWEAAWTDPRTTGQHSVALTATALTDINNCINSGSKLLGLAVKNDDETIGANRYIAIDGYDQPLPPTLTLVIGVPAENEPPIADAGPNQTVDEGDTVTLTGAASSDPDGSITSYSWTQLAGPTVALATPNAATCDFTAPEVSETTTMTFQLTVTDNSGATATDMVNVFVQDTTPPAVPTVARSFRQLIA
jgi:hypothetical protein